MRFIYQTLITLYYFLVHQNNKLQVINVATEQIEYIPIKDSNMIHAILVDSANVVCAAPNELQIWKAKNLKLPPRILPLQGNKEIEKTIDKKGNDLKKKRK